MQQLAFEGFSENGTKYLKPVFEKLNGVMDYDELKILRLIYLSEHPDSI